MESVINSERNIKNGRTVCVHFFRYGFSLIELVMVLAILMLITPMVFTGGTQSEEKKAIEEARNLADWLEQAFIRSNITKQRFRITESNAISPRFHIEWISASSTKNEFYDSSGKALFMVWITAPSEYNPLMGYLEEQFAMTIRVYCGSDKLRRKVIRYVIISRFGRVRVSEFPPL